MEHDETNPQTQHTPELDAAELESESVTELPDREAMTVLSGGPAPVGPIWGYDELQPPAEPYSAQ